jgi:hypothetical protein
MVTGRLRHVRFAPHCLAAACGALLAGCITSSAPLLTDAQPPLLGERLHMHLYALHDGAAHDPAEETFQWQNGRYASTAGTGGSATGIGDFTLHPFEGGAMIAQSTRAGQPTDYAVVRKLADGTYLADAIDEADADDTTRRQFCATDATATCRVTTPEAVLAFARATAAKSFSAGGLVVLLADQ